MPASDAADTGSDASAIGRGAGDGPLLLEWRVRAVTDAGLPVLDRRFALAAGREEAIAVAKARGREAWNLEFRLSRTGAGAWYARLPDLLDWEAEGAPVCDPASLWRSEEEGETQALAMLGGVRRHLLRGVRRSVISGRDARAVLDLTDRLRRDRRSSPSSTAW